MFFVVCDKIINMVIFFLYCFILACWLYWLVFYWRGGTKIASDIQHSLDDGTSRLDTAALIAILTSNLVLVGTGFALVLGWLPYKENLPRVSIGAFLTLIGMVGTFYCRSYLGRLWAADVTLQDGHHVVDRGPYGIVRHPIYTTVLIMYFGTTIAFLTWWTFLAYVVILVAHVVKTSVEDQFLFHELSGYAEYKKKVHYKLIPFVW